MNIDTGAKLVTGWQLEPDSFVRRRLGKLGEECGELMQAKERCLLQGIEGVDPSTGKRNVDWLAEEIADVVAQCECIIRALKLSRASIQQLVDQKVMRMDEWEALLRPPG